MPTPAAVRPFRAISEDTFDATFRPLLGGENGEPQDDPTDASWARFDDWHTPAIWSRITAAAAEGKCWTALDADCGCIVVVSGLHYVNRIYYLITAVAVPQDEDVQVHFDVPDEGCTTTHVIETDV